MKPKKAIECAWKLKTHCQNTPNCSDCALSADGLCQIHTPVEWNIPTLEHKINLSDQELRNIIGLVKDEGLKNKLQKILDDEVLQ